MLASGQDSNVLPGFYTAWDDGQNETASERSALCPKPARRIWRADANFLLATEPEMCYNIPVKTSTATATPEKPGSTTSRAVTTIPPSVVSSMRIPLLARGKVS